MGSTKQSSQEGAPIAPQAKGLSLPKSTMGGTGLWAGDVGFEANFKMFFIGVERDSGEGLVVLPSVETGEGVAAVMARVRALGAARAVAPVGASGGLYSK